MKESYLWAQLKAAIGDSAHLCRIENTAGAGISDVNGCRNGREIWIELKMFHGARLHFRTSQLNWIFTRGRHNGMVWVLARDGDEVRLWDANVLLKSSERRSQTEKSFSIVPGTPPIWSSRKPFKWGELSEVLFSTGESFSTQAGTFPPNLRA